MGTIIKANKYRLVDNHAFDMPLPLKFEILNKDSAVAEYEISEDENVSYRILTKYKEEMLTTIRRPLSISDIYYLFSCRVFQDRTPFTLFELSLLGLEKYNVYNILQKTRGVTPFDTYWIKFDGDTCTYDEALEAFNSITAPAYISAAEAEQPQQLADINEVLNQQKFDVASIAPINHMPPASDKSSQDTAASAKVIVPDDIAEEHEDTLVNNKMSEDEIEALLRSVGLSENPEPPVEPSGKMSQADIEALLAANSTPEPAPEPAPAEPSGGKMSQDDIAALFAANAAQSEPATEPAEPSGSKMSQADIEALFAANSAPEPEPAPAPAEPSGGKMSQADIEALFAANSAPEPAPEPAPAESGGKMSQADIEALLQSMQDDASN